MMLPYSFFARDTRTVARDLLGKTLVRRMHGEYHRSLIVETEAYHGWSDTASHAYKGMTKRTRPMFASPGTLYVYLIYGMYHCLNVATVRQGFPAAVLIRATEDIQGPGRLCNKFCIDRTFSGHRYGRKTHLWFEDSGRELPSSKIVTGERVGIEYASASRHLKWRYLVHGFDRASRVT